MKRLTIATLLAFSAAAYVPAFAQQPAQEQKSADPQVQALSQSVIDLTGQTVQLRAQIITDQAEIKRLTADNDHLKAAAKPAEAAKPETPAGK